MLSGIFIDYIPVFFIFELPWFIYIYIYIYIYIFINHPIKFLDRDNKIKLVPALGGAQFSGWQLALGNQTFPAQVRLPAMCRSEVPAATPGQCIRAPAKRVEVVKKT